MPYLLRHGLAGTLAGWLAAATLLTIDTGGLGALVMASDLFPTPLVLLFGFFGLTFASVAMGAAIMGLGRAEPRGPVATQSVARPAPASTSAAP